MSVHNACGTEPDVMLLGVTFGRSVNRLPMRRLRARENLRGVADHVLVGYLPTIVTKDV